MTHYKCQSNLTGVQSRHPKTEMNNRISSTIYRRYTEWKNVNHPHSNDLPIKPVLLVKGAITTIWSVGNSLSVKKVDIETACHFYLYVKILIINFFYLYFTQLSNS